MFLVIIVAHVVYDDGVLFISIVVNFVNVRFEVVVHLV